MLLGVFLAVFALAAGSTYLALFPAVRERRNVLATTGVAMLSWAVLVPSAADVQTATDQGLVSTASPPVQGLCLLCALLMGLAFAGAVFGKYPTEDPTDGTTER